MSNFLKGDKIRLKKTASKNKSVVFVADGKRCDIPFGTVLTVSTKTGAAIADLEADPSPVISKDFVNRNDNIQQLFEMVEPADN